MKIEVLGSRGKIKPSAPGYQRHTGFLIDQKILIDVGEPEYLDLQPEAVVFTHYHPDHAYFLYKKETFSPGVPHYGPEAHPLLPDLQVITAAFTLNGYSITPVPVIHALELKSLGYVIEKDRKRVLITGDVAWIEKDHLEHMEELDLVITEATVLAKGGRIHRSGDLIYGHTGVPNLIGLFRPLTPKLVFTHYGNWFFEDVSKGPEHLRALQPPDLEIFPAKDGFTIRV